ncbi:MAG: winged helix-turn-helix transcriptional regulator [Planctomycetes bacterium]|nr:winged helix-turn-helix transcriptional regulator [Planctomycetota bacterium]
MFDDRSTPAAHVLKLDEFYVEQQIPRRRRVERYERVVGPWSYRALFGRGTLQLTSVEYRILKFLASRPYHAFTRKRIAEAVSTDSQPVTVETLGRHIRTLRDQLGFYSDYIQTVPYTGYRFKA